MVLVFLIYTMRNHFKPNLAKLAEGEKRKMRLFIKRLITRKTL